MTRAGLSPGRLLRDRLEAPLRAALSEHGASDPGRIAELVQSTVHTISRMIENGLSLGKATSLAHELLNPDLRRTTT